MWSGTNFTRSVCPMDLKLPLRRYASVANGVVLRWETQMKNRRIIYTIFLAVACSATGAPASHFGPRQIRSEPSRGRTYSYFNATNGSTRVARLAGKWHASDPIPATSTTTAPNAQGSVAETPQIWLAKNRVNP